MGKTFRDLGDVATITSTYILAVSRDDTDEAFKTTINNIKDYILSTGGVAAEFTDLSLGAAIIRSTSTIEFWQLASAQLMDVSASAVAIGKITALSYDTTWLSFEDSSEHQFYLGSSDVSKVTATSMQCEQIKSIAVSNTRVDLASTLDFYASSASPVVALASASTVVLDKLHGLTETGNIIDLNVSPGSKIGFYGGSNESLMVHSDGEIDMPNRNIVAAWGAEDQYIEVGSPIRLPNVVADPLSQRDDDHEITLVRAGMQMTFIIQVVLASKAWLNTDYVKLYTGWDPFTTQGMSTFRMVQQTYSATCWFKGSFTSTESLGWFGITTSSSCTVSSAYGILMIEQ